MRFLETIEGRNGEDLTSAVLKYLLENSSLMRDCFVRRLKDAPRTTKTPTFRDGIICQNEVAVSSEEGAGRIDLLIQEKAGMVFGLENKFWARFTENQPGKYWSELVRRATNNDASICRIIVLIPKEREQEVSNHLTGITDKCCTLFWEQIQDDLRTLAQDEGGETGVVATFLNQYVASQLRAIDITIEKSQLLEQQVQFPNEFHYDFLNQLKSCLPNPGRIRPAKNWIGFSFNVEPSTESKTYATQWFGFVRADEQMSVNMGIDTGLPQYMVDPQLPWAHVKPQWNKAFIKVDYDESLKSTLAWRDKLAKILKPLAKQVLDNPLIAN